jgi:FkbM family methyltransferase
LLGFGLRHKWSGKKFYAQNLQDIGALTFSRSEGNYIDLGAAYSVKYSNTKLLQTMGWTGVLVEPNVRFHPELQERVDSYTKLVKSAIGVEKGKEILLDAGPLSSLERFKDLDRYANLRKKLSDRDGEYLVEVVTLRSVIAEFFENSRIDYLSIDIEGMDIQVLRSIFEIGIFPNFVTIEHNYVWKSMIEMQSLADQFGYQIVCRTISAQDYWFKRLQS